MRSWRFLALALILCFLGCRAPAGPITITDHQELSPSQHFRVGFALHEFTPDKHYPLAGFGGGLRRERFPVLFGAGFFGRLSLSAAQSLYGTDPDRYCRSHYLAGARGASDPLQAGAMVIIPKGQEPLALCRLDLIVMTSALHDAVFEELRDLGISKDRLILTATHTHSGVGAYHQEVFPKLIAMDNFRPEIFEALTKSAATAIRWAFNKAQPATLGLAKVQDPGTAEGGVSKNRRARQFKSIGHDDKDPEILMLVARARSKKKTRGKQPILGVLLNYAIHPTVLGPDNLYFSADVAGALQDRVSKALPGQPPVLFFNGAEGDIGPNKHDLKHRGGLMACQEIGQRCAKLVRSAILECEGFDELALASAMAERDFGKPFAYFCTGDREAFLEALDDPGTWLTFPLTLPLNLPLWILALPEAQVILTWNLRFGLFAALGNYASSTTFRMSAARMKFGPHDIVLAGVPGEATHDVGLDIKARAAKRGASTTFVLGLANDAMSYIASEDKYFLGGYEAMATLFGPKTSENLVSGIEKCMEEIYREP